MIPFVIGVVLGKWLTGSWLLAVVAGVACSIFLSNNDKD